MKILLSLFFSLLTIGTFSQSVVIDSTFNPGTGFNDQVRIMAIQPDGKILVGGDYTTFNGATYGYLVRLNENGLIDSTFNIGMSNGPVLSISIQTNGKIIVGGFFSSVNGSVGNGIARLNTNGTPDTTFNSGTGFNNYVSATYVQPDGKIIVGGWFTSFDGKSINRIARLNTDGKLDTNFVIGSGFNGSVDAISLQSNGKIITGGAFLSFNGILRRRIARLNFDGSLDTSFNPNSGFNDNVLSLSLQTDGKLIVGGSFNAFNGIMRSKIARLNIDGSIDTTFDSSNGFNNHVHSTAIQYDGKVIVGGKFTTYNGIATNRIARLNIDGSFDSTFTSGLGFNNTLKSIAIQSNNKIVVGGEYTSYNGIARNRIARIQDTSILVSVSEIENIEKKQPKIHIYPNPSNENITIKLPDKLKNSTIELYSSMGQLIQVVKPKNQIVQMQISGSPGIYLVHIRGQDGTIAKSIIKQ